MARGGFPAGFGGGGNMNKMLQQAQRMQQQIGKIQQELQEREYEASSGGGMVAARMSGKKELLQIKINPEAVDPQDVEMLEDMIVAAVNEAIRQVEEDAELEMGKVTGGLPLGF